MTDITDLELRRLEREASEAKALLQNPLLSRTIEAMRESIHKNWGATLSDQPERRELLFQELLAVKRFEQMLKSMINKGTIALNELQSREDSSADG